MANYSLTDGIDTISGTPNDDFVYATAATLNAGDSLTGGAGTDVLALIGTGNFHVDELASFTGFERIQLENATNYSANLTLGNQPIEVDATGYLFILVNSPSNWNGSNIINGDSSQTFSSTYLQFNNWSNPAPPVTYDLTTNTFSHVRIYASGNDITFLINNAVTAGVQAFDANNNFSDKLETASSTLDLSHTTVSGFRVASSNGLGTTFTVGDLGTAFQIDGGSGHDTLIAQGFTLTADQRTAIFNTSSIETIIASVPDDFNGDGKSDILWRNTAGNVVEWDMNGVTVAGSGAIGGDLNWRVAGTGDFNGDGETDILWRHEPTGTVVEWEMDGRTVTSAGAIGGDLNWRVAGTGDYNGDGKTDIMWRDGSSGTVVLWHMDDRTVLSSGVIGGDTNWAPVAGSSVMNSNETGGAVTASAALLGQSIT